MMNVKEDPQVVIARVDCTKEDSLCSQHDITSYPTIRFFKQGEEGETSVKFSGTRDMTTFSEFLNNQLHPPMEESDDGGEGMSSSTKEGKQQTTPSMEEVAAAATAKKSPLVELTEENFDKHISTGYHFVKFYAPWCGHCQRLAPTWNDLARKLADNTAVSVAKIDCSVYRPICRDFNVKSYPSLLWIDDGKMIEKYSGDRNLESLYSFVQRMLGVEVSEEKQQTAETETVSQTKEDNKLEVLELGKDNYNEEVIKGIIFIKFYAPWCGHCQQLKPIWEKLARTVHGDDHLQRVRIAKIDCTLPENKRICSVEQVEGFPTLLAFKNGKRQSEYLDGRSLELLLRYVQSLVGHDEL